MIIKQYLKKLLSKINLELGDKPNHAKNRGD